MKQRPRAVSLFGQLLVAAICSSPSIADGADIRRVVILKIDGLNADLLNQLMDERNPSTGKSKLPWLTHIFRENGTVFSNFYVRGISLSAPSWSMLDSGRPTVIRGNVEYDRYTGRTYDYLNFFPFYINYARLKEVDMPGVEVLDRAGIPLVIDAFSYQQEYQSFQLFQRGVRWATLKAVLKRRVKSQLFLSPVESFGPESLDTLLGQQTEAELKDSLRSPEVLYLDDYTGDIDHEGHATNQIAALTDTLAHIDALTGRLWTAIQNSPLSQQTLFIVVSDHGMNNRPDVFSQAFSLPDFFNSPAAGGHHVITNRHQLSDFKLMGLDPLVQRVITPSTASPYLAGQASHYPTAWLDLDGNERAAVQLRNSDLNRIHILLQQLARTDLAPPVRSAAATYLAQLIATHRAQWSATGLDLHSELDALAASIDQRKDDVREAPRKFTDEQHDRGADKEARRLKRDLYWWEHESKAYHEFLQKREALLAFHPDPLRPFRGSISDLVPDLLLGDQNQVADLQHYAVGPAASGLTLNAAGHLDEERSFRYVDYFPLLRSQTVRNNPQPQLPLHPIDFVAVRLPDTGVAARQPEARHGYWLYGGDDAQLVILTDAADRLTLRAVKRLRAQTDGALQWEAAAFAPGLPLHLFEDANLELPQGVNRAQWLGAWHSEQEWLRATHRCLYSTGVIGIVEELSPVGDRVPGRPGISPLLLRYERRRRELVQADFHIFAADGWNFNARNFNPGGNHGSFFRISTHSVWMMAGDGVPIKTIAEPYDSLNFASTLLSLLGRPVPLPERVVTFR